LEGPPTQRRRYRYRTAGFVTGTRGALASVSRRPSDPPPHARAIRVVLVAESALHAALLERNDHKVLQHEQHDGHEPHQPCARDQRGTDGEHDPAEIHRISGPPVWAARNEH